VVNRFLPSLLCMLAVGILPPSAGRAAEPALALSLDAATALALRQNSTYRAADTEVARSRGARRTAEAPFPANPAIEVEAGPLREDDATHLGYAAKVEQRLDLPGQRQARLRAADERIGLAEARRQAVAAEVRARVRIAYVAALVAQRQREFADHQVAYLERTYEAARVRVESGATSAIERRLAESELGRARVTCSQAAGMEQRTLQDLRAILAIAYDRPLALTTPLSAPSVRDLDRGRLVETARARRRDLLTLRQEGKAIDADIARWRSERLPQVAVTVMAQQDAPGAYWVGPGVQVGLPVWQRYQGEIAVATADRQRQQIELDAAEQAAARDLWVACDLAERRREEVALFERSVLAAAEGARDLVFDGWQAGKFDVFRVLTAERDLVTAQLGYLQDLSALWEAEIEIDRALGVIDEGGK